MRTLNVDGDRQADLRVHGRRDKAVYAYPSEFYELWRQERPELEIERSNGRIAIHQRKEGDPDPDRHFVRHGITVPPARGLT